MSYDVAPSSCGKTWVGGGHDMRGDQHTCGLPQGHGLTCRCNCGAGKWTGKSLKEIQALRKASRV